MKIDKHYLYAVRERLKEAFRVNTNKELAEKLGMSPKLLSKLASDGSINSKVIHKRVLFAILRGDIDVNRLKGVFREELE